MYVCYRMGEWPSGRTDPQKECLSLVIIQQCNDMAILVIRNPLQLQSYHKYRLCIFVFCVTARFSIINIYSSEALSCSDSVRVLGMTASQRIWQTVRHEKNKAGGLEDVRGCALLWWCACAFVCGCHWEVMTVVSQDGRNNSLIRPLLCTHP